MAKQSLPYFKFKCLDWIGGSITQEDFYEQGVFTNVCAHYWKNLGKLSLDEVKKRLKKVRAKSWEQLIASDLIKVDGNGMISIEFLDEQLNERASLSSQNSRNGKLGGRKANQSDRLATATDRKANQSNIEQEKEKEQEKEGEKDAHPHDSNSQQYGEENQNAHETLRQHSQSGETNSGEENQVVETKSNKTRLPLSPPGPVLASASHWASVIPASTRESQRRIILGKFREATDEQIKQMIICYEPWLDLKFTAGCTMKHYETWFYYFITDQKNLPQTGKAIGNNVSPAPSGPYAKAK